MTESVKINPGSRWRRFRSSRRGKQENKKLLERLARCNLELWDPIRIRSALGVDQGDLAALEALAARPDGWHDYMNSPDAVPGDYDRLAALGLIRFKWRTPQIYLTDAARFLLSLTAVSPFNDEDKC